MKNLNKTEAELKKSVYSFEFSKKKKVFRGKALFFVISPFRTPYSICRSVGF